MLFDPFVVPSTDPSKSYCVFTKSVCFRFQKRTISDRDRENALSFCVFIHCISFVKNCEVCRTRTPLSICQSCQTTSLSVSVSIPHRTSSYFALFAKKTLPSIRSSLCPAKFGLKDLLSRGGTLLFWRFLLRRRSDSSFFLVGLILGLNQPFCPHIWRWAGSGVRLGNDGIQSTELDEQIILHEEYVYPHGDPKKVCVWLNL